jgi:hypothetical protein
MTRLTPIDTGATRINCLNWSYASRSVLRQCRRWCRSVSTLVSDVSIVSKSVQVSIDTSVKVSSRGSSGWVV